MWEKSNKGNSIEEIFKNSVGINDLSEANAWFTKHYNHEYHIQGLKEAVEFAKEFKHKPVRIVGDYDVDGTASTSILLFGLRWSGFNNVTYRIPHRFSEGFGINETIVDEIDEGLIICCDNGLAQNEAIKKAKKKGLSVIILDHHLPESDAGTTIESCADYVIDPAAYPETADFCGYCGAGLCYKFCEILLNYDKVKLAKLSCLAAIATIADVMQLKEENYVLVKNAMSKFMLNIQTNVPGLYAILAKAGKMNHLTAKDIAFAVAPVINASSRMNDTGADNVVEILSYYGPYEDILDKVDALFAVNNLRKEAQKDALTQAHDIISKNKMEQNVPLVVYIPDVHEGIVGIVAGQLADEYRTPTFVVTNVGDGQLKGSARTSGNYDIKKNLDIVSKLLTVYGGHKEAAGLTLPEENLKAFCKTLSKNANDFIRDDETDSIYYDLEIDAKDISDCIKGLEKFEPFGEGNPMPIFKINNFDSVGLKQLLGSDKNTVKLRGKYADALGFKMAERMSFIEDSPKYSFIGTLADNYFRNNVTHQIEFIDFAI